jgi:hypothetical protein
MKFFRKLAFNALLTILFLQSHLFAQQSIDDALNSISSAQLIQTTGFLSSSRFKGRLQGTAEYEEAARYVATRFKQLGLKPVNQESFLHFFNVETNHIDRAFVALYDKTGQNITPLELGKDFNCRGFTGSGNFTAPLVFVGFGLDNDELTDYKDIDVNGKIVLVIKGAPGWKSVSGSWGDVSPRQKARIALSKGALAIVILPNPSEPGQRELIGSVACGNQPHLSSFPMVQITRNITDTILRNVGKSYNELLDEINTSKKSQSIYVPTRMTINIIANYQPEAPTPNVVAMWEGSHRRKKKEFVVLGAHLDHVGEQSRTLLYPGANDNASGVATLIEIAKALRAGKIKTDRSILFVVFSAEESGMYGSRHFVSNSPANVNKMVAMVNFDCVAQGDSIAVGGKLSFPKTWNIAKRNDAKHTQLLSIKTFGGGGADAEAFYRVGIPTLYFNTSAGYKHLHLESDSTETLNPELFEKLTKLGLLTTLELSDKSYKREKEKRRK